MTSLPFNPVNISGQSRGWIRKVQLEFPDDASTTKATGHEPFAKPAELFRVAWEETGAFPGNWG